jgi:hypothetical protein
MRVRVGWQFWITVIFAVLGLVAALQHDWATAGTLLGIVAFRCLLVLADANGWLEPKFDLARFRQGSPVEERLVKPLDPRKLAPVMIVVALGWEAAVIGIGGVLLRAPSWAIDVGSLAVIPLAVVVALMLARRLPNQYR